VTAIGQILMAANRQMTHATERSHQLTNGLTLDDLPADQLRSESLL
jgi:hypothetical protein